MASPFAKASQDKSQDRPFFTIIVVSLNPGAGLGKTLQSIAQQTFTDYEVLMKDGGSNDGSLDDLPDDPRIRVVEQPNSGIFDAMNQAVMESSGQFINFLNCGDTFYGSSVIKLSKRPLDDDCESPVLHPHGKA